MSDSLTDEEITGLVFLEMTMQVLMRTDDGHPDINAMIQYTTALVSPLVDSIFQGTEAGTRFREVFHANLPHARAQKDEILNRFRLRFQAAKSAGEEVELKRIKP